MHLGVTLNETILYILKYFKPIVWSYVTNSLSAKSSVVWLTVNIFKLMGLKIHSSLCTGSIEEKRQGIIKVKSILRRSLTAHTVATTATPTSSSTGSHCTCHDHLHLHSYPGYIIVHKHQHNTYPDVTHHQI